MAAGSERRFGWRLVVAALAVALIATLSSGTDPQRVHAGSAQLVPTPSPGPFSMDLYRPGDSVPQQTKYWCVSASVQTMINIMEDGKPNRSRSFQRKLHFQARGLDDRYDDFWREVAGEPRWDKGLHGLGLKDWSGVLNARGYGPYELDRAPSRKQAIRRAARAIRLTGKPAGLVVWRGAHAWVMSGFEATADPAYADEFTVKRVFIQDPWYPTVSTIWGTSRPPGVAVPVKALDEDFLRYNRPGRKHPMRDGKYMLVLPTVETNVVAEAVEVADRPSDGEPHLSESPGPGLVDWRWQALLAALLPAE